MSNFFDEAKDLAHKDPKLADKAVQEAGQVADDKTGGKFDNQVQDAERELGTDNQNQN